jgi:hypothetical protein
MRRFQSILYITRGTADERDALKQVLSPARSIMRRSCTQSSSVHCFRGNLGECEVSSATPLRASSERSGSR